MDTEHSHDKVWSVLSDRIAITSGGWAAGFKLHLSLKDLLYKWQNIHPRWIGRRPDSVHRNLTQLVRTSSNYRRFHRWCLALPFPFRLCQKSARTIKRQTLFTTHFDMKKKEPRSCRGSADKNLDSQIWDHWFKTTCLNSCALGQGTLSSAQSLRKDLKPLVPWLLPHKRHAFLVFRGN